MYTYYYVSLPNRRSYSIHVVQWYVLINHSDNIVGGLVNMPVLHTVRLRLVKTGKTPPGNSGLLLKSNIQSKRFISDQIMRCFSSG